MYKIGEFSRLGQVSSRMLRHYDRLGLLAPSHTDEWTGYRYYTVDQLAQLNRIIALKGLGFSLEEIGRLLDGNEELDTRQMRSMLLLRQAELEQEIRETQARLAQVEARLWQIEQEGQPPPYDIVVKPLEPVALASVRRVVPAVAEMGQYCQAMYVQLYVGLARLRVKPLAPEITLYHAEEYTETDLDVETGVVIDPAVLPDPPQDAVVTFRQLPAVPLAACLVYEGPFGEMLPAILELLKWIGLHRHTPAGFMRELHLSGPAHEAEQEGETAVVEFQIPIEEPSSFAS
ncbi:MAG: MerR family transcriptional regulator [Chloroflexi bacterium]|nr:MerR family transcriptional regulator [Chloroflexota bacterium]MCI0578697.1 MerR family transcriptional regulator [Chloroflexota bacterium]MCI0648357.1 MerR family transcriptional regulator [Chloroflexota bacterium]MCI0731175.1 MerR family transcriptional regulator [Chloroflexota bacterium]